MRNLSHTQVDKSHLLNQVDSGCFFRTDTASLKYHALGHSLVQQTLDASVSYILRRHDRISLERGAAQQVSDFARQAGRFTLLILMRPVQCARSRLCMQ
jgi:hypothetical protein